MSSVANNRKSQITLFIIIGIIILFSVGIYSYMRVSEVKEVKVEQQAAPPVVEFIDACIDKVATEGIRYMGDQGGYITIPIDIRNNPTRYVSLVPGTGGEFAPKIPYWYFDGKSMIPSIKYMENQVEEYVDANLEYCLRNYSGMRDEYTILEKSNYSADVTFAEKDAIIDLYYSVEIQPKGKAEVIQREKFTVKVDVQIQRMWNLSKTILERENIGTFFENMTMNLMASHPPEDIPFTGMSLDCNRKQWLISDVKRKVIKALEPAVAATRFENTNHPPFQADDDTYAAIHRTVESWRESQKKTQLVLPKKIPSDSYDYFQYYFRGIDGKYTDLKTVATYNKGWGMSIVATPNRHGVMQSGKQDLKSEILSYLCLNTYHFVYDLTYPVMISTHDPNAFHKTGFTFRFAFPVQIFHNRADRSLLSTAIKEPAEYTMDFCSFTAPENHTIIARDTVTNSELSRVNLSFRCISEQCVLGTTRTNNRHLQWYGQFPEGCSGAVIIANRSGYLLTERQYDGTEPFYIDMHPTQTVQFDVKRHAENAPDSAKMLEKDMYALIQIEKNDPEVSIFGMFGDKDRFNNSGTLELLRDDATYDVNIMLFKQSGDKSKDDQLIGGWMGNWTVALEDMLDARKVIFHVPQKYPLPTKDEELLDTYEIMTNRSIFPKAEPEIIRADEYVEGESTA
jgi:hypothetical protein